jgi:hypothetical protein
MGHAGADFLDGGAGRDSIFDDTDAGVRGDDGSDTILDDERTTGSRPAPVATPCRRAPATTA